MTSISRCLGMLTVFTALGLTAAPAAQAQQTLYVANQGSGKGDFLEAFNSAGVGSQFNVSGDLDGPGGLAFNSAGNLFVSNYKDNTITKFDSAGVGTQFNVSGNVNQPTGLAFGPSPAAVPEASTTVSLGLLLALGLGRGMVVAAKRRTKPTL